MRELQNDPFYEMIGNYKNCIIDYCLIEDDTPYQGERSHKDAVLFLREWKQTQEGYRQTYGDLYQNTGYVFTNKLGKPFHPDSISSWFGRFVRGNDLPPIHLHSLRHTNTSLMIANGVDVETVSKRLGHADAQTTITIYTHQIRTADAAAAEMLDEFVSGRRK